MKVYRLLLTFVLLQLLQLSYAQYDTLRLVYYNVLDYPNSAPGKEVYFRTTMRYLQPDIILVNELKTTAGANLLLNSGLNVYGTNHYQMAVYTQQDFSENLLYYNSDKLALYSQDVISTNIRDIDEYVLYYKSADLASTTDTIFFYFYEAHLKANMGFENERLSEVNAFLQHLNAIPNAENVFFGGDFNMYTSSEPGYQAIINNSTYVFNDPLPAGNWHNSSTYSQIHTQSTRTADFGGGSTGGLDDRFDFTLFTSDVSSGSKRVKYIPGSCIAFGNDGNHFNKALIDLPTNPNLPDSVIQALYLMSDHLPVVSDYRVEANPPVPSQNIVITEIMYNPPDIGLDTLEFIELYNQGTQTQDLQGFQFIGVDMVFPSTSINPGEFLVVAANASAMMNTFGVSALQWAAGGLGNGGELILLKDSFGATVDSVNYGDASPWPSAPDGLGPSLILCDFLADNSLAVNWAASTNFVVNNADGNPIYASPGFSECVLPPTANFSASPNPVNAGGSVQFTDLSLNSPDAWSWTFQGGNPSVSSLQNPLVIYDTPGTYDVQLMVSNGAGSDTKIMTGYFSVLSNNPVLIITEIMQNPSFVSDSDGEWFEVYNPTSAPIDMLAWTVKDNDFDLITINSSLIVPAYGFATLGLNSNSTINGCYTCTYQYSGLFLANGADELVLLAPDNSEIDRVEYDGGPLWPDPTGKSMVFTGTATDNNNDPSFWTTANLRETSYTGTSGDFGSPGSNGNLQNLSNPVRLQLKLYLQGAFTGGTMTTGLNSVIPMAQPFQASPWNYSGSELLASVPPAMVDWLLLELRDAPSASSATASTIVERKAAILLSDGSVVDVSGISPIQWSVSISQNLFVVVRHRNHLATMSALGLSQSAGIYAYDFTTGMSQAYNGGQTEIATGVYGMISGDSDGSGLIDANDKSIDWENGAGKQGYLNADLNLDSEVSNTDKNDYWLPQIGQSKQVPQ